MTMTSESAEKQGRTSPPGRRKNVATLIFSVVLVVVSIAVAVIFSLISMNRQLTPLESTLLQGLSLMAGFAGSYLFGMISARDTAQEIIKPHARSAFRRVLYLYTSLSRLARAIDRARASESDAPKGFTHLDTLQAIVFEQIATAGDSLEDWRDIVPEDVAEVEGRLRRGEPLVGSGGEK